MWMSVDVRWDEGCYTYVNVYKCVCVYKRANSIPDNLHQFTRRTFFSSPISADFTHPPRLSFFFVLGLFCFFFFFFLSPIPTSLCVCGLFQRRPKISFDDDVGDDGDDDDGEINNTVGKKRIVGCSTLPSKVAAIHFSSRPRTPSSRQPADSPFYDAISFSLWVLLFIIRWYVRIYILYIRREPARAVYIFQIATVFSLVRRPYTTYCYFFFSKVYLFISSTLFAALM